MNKKRKVSGFTLAELLIVVAIIGVLVAVSIPIFTNQLEKAREATDLANIRAAYAEVMVEAINDPDKEFSREVDMQQKVPGWKIADVQKTLEQLVDKGTDLDMFKKHTTGKCVISWGVAKGTNEGHVTITFSEKSKHQGTGTVNTQ